MEFLLDREAQEENRNTTFIAHEQVKLKEEKASDSKPNDYINKLMQERMAEQFKT